MARRQATLREWQWLVAGIALVFVAALAWKRGWPFDGSEFALPGEPSLAQLLFADPLTRGFARLAIAVITLYAVASIPALVVAGRWIRGLNTSGMEVDEASEDAPRRVKRLEAQITALTKERDWLEERARMSLEAGEQTVEESERTMSLLQRRESQEEGSGPPQG